MEPYLNPAPETPPAKAPLSEALARTERTLIERALQACHGHIAAAAEMLDLTRQGLYKKIKRLGIDPDDLPVSYPTPAAITPLDPAPRTRLSHAAVSTANLAQSLPFYTDVLGLRLLAIEPDPIRKGRRRAMLHDEAGNAVMEFIELPELESPTIPGRGSIHHLGFTLPEPEWHALRERLETLQYGHLETQNRLFVRDADGMMLEIEPR